MFVFVTMGFGSTVYNVVFLLGGGGCLEFSFFFLNLPSCVLQ